MKSFATLMFVCAVLVALGPVLPWIIGIAVAVGGIAVIAYAIQEAQLPEEEKAERRRQQRERDHATKMAQIEHARIAHQSQLEEEHQRRRRREAVKSSTLNVVGKIAAGVLVNTLTGGTHRHRH